MKNSVKTYILLAAVLGIWSIIAYKFFNGIHPDVPSVKQESVLTTFNIDIQEKADTFLIETAYKDPFLGTLNKPKTKKAKPLSNKPDKKDEPQFPNIVFNGVIKDQNNQIFIVAINGTQYLMKQGHTLNGVTLISGNDKAIQIRYNNKNATISIQ